MRLDLARGQVVSAGHCTCAEWRVDYLDEFKRQVDARAAHRARSIADDLMVTTLGHSLIGCRLWCSSMRAQFDDTSFVYFVQVAGSGPIKIGTTRNVDQRIATMQCAHAAPLTVFSVTSGGEPFERLLHATFSKARIRGEWFRPIRSLFWLAYEMDDRPGRRRSPEEVVEFAMDVAAERSVA